MDTPADQAGKLVQALGWGGTELRRRSLVRGPDLGQARLERIVDRAESEPPGRIGAGCHLPASDEILRMQLVAADAREQIGDEMSETASFGELDDQYERPSLWRSLVALFF